MLLLHILGVIIAIFIPQAGQFRRFQVLEYKFVKENKIFWTRLGPAKGFISNIGSKPAAC